MSAEKFGIDVQSFQHVELSVGTTLYRMNDRFKYAYFPESGLISLVQILEEGSVIEVGIIGTEGFLGVPLALGLDTSTTEAIVQGPGHAIRIPAPAFRAMIKEHPDFHQCLLTYVQFLQAQVSQTAACNARHSLHQRLARWLLEAYDRIRTPVMELRHEFLAQMLGSRRAGVTVAMGRLRLAGAVTLRRGGVEVLNARRLEAEACECFRTVKKTYAQLLGGPGKPSGRARKRN
jgi:CRP-like cAMP-binding protein